MKPDTMACRLREMDESISRLYGLWAEVAVSLKVLEARLAPLGADPGLEVGRPTSPPPVPAGRKDEAGGR